jgi:hypothetical protein
LRNNESPAAVSMAARMSAIRPSLRMSSTNGVAA